MCVQVEQGKFEYEGSDFYSRIAVIPKEVIHFFDERKLSKLSTSHTIRLIDEKTYVMLYFASPQKYRVFCAQVHSEIEESDIDVHEAQRDLSHSADHSDTSSVFFQEVPFEQPIEESDIESDVYEARSDISYSADRSDMSSVFYQEVLVPLRKKYKDRSFPSHRVRFGYDNWVLKKEEAEMLTYSPSKSDNSSGDESSYNDFNGKGRTKQMHSHFLKVRREARKFAKAALLSAESDDGVTVHIICDKDQQNSLPNYVYNSSQPPVAHFLEPAPSPQTPTAS